MVLINLALRRVAPVVAVVLFTAAMSAMGRTPGAGDVRITVEQLDDARLRVTYDLKRRKRELIFGEVAAGYRERRWKIETPGFKLLRLDTEDRIVRSNGAKFERVVLVAAPDIIRLKKEYQPITRYGEGGALVYTGHFWPMTGKGGRTNATFSFAPASGGEAVAFGERVARLTDWRSPMAHPAFVYLGPLEPVETAELMALVDPGTPQWIIGEFYDLTPRAFAWLADAFGFSPQTKPNLFLAAPLGRDEGRLSYAGDALPGQFQITLEGAAWKSPSDKAKGIFRRSTIHEAVHLWQSAARPSVEDVAAWIHEGAADAIAAEALVGLGLWERGDFSAGFEKARAECARELEDGSLNGAQARRDFRAIYACGHVIAVAVSKAEGRPVADFWRAFIPLAEEHNGYTEDLFYELVGARTGNPEFVEALHFFAATPLADPAREIDRLMAAAGAPLAPSKAR